MSWLTDILYMNGYGQYVWPSYALVFLTLFAIWIVSRQQANKSARELAAMEEIAGAAKPGKRKKRRS